MRRDHRAVHQINLLDKVAQAIDKGFQVHQALEVQHARGIEVDRVSHPTHRQVLDMRRFAA
ncbi:hypothetical protein D3C71_2155890 [compost metagenome]